jgi:hypothetical protein
MGTPLEGNPIFGSGSDKRVRYKVVHEDGISAGRFWIYDIYHVLAQPLPTPYPTREEADAVCKLLNEGEDV